MRHEFKKIEPKWQARWEEAKIFNAVDGSDKPKFYGLVEFPYPSGAGMHVGHIKAYSSIEVVSRKRRMQGYNVLFPIGFDAYGLPTENYAIKTNTHPRIITDNNIEKFSNQLKKVGFSFDWDRVVDTTEEGFYKWTQWIFLKMFEKGLVYRDRASVNYCPSCKVVLSNEDSQGGKCDICHSDVVQKSKDVWYLRITQYADKLLKGLDTVEYPENIKQQQVNWIGKSTGAFVDFDIDGIEDKLQIYTTRPDTLFGVTFMVIAPEHPLIDKYADKIANMDAVLAYREECNKKTEFERTQLVKDKTGVKLDGIEAINPLNGKKIPVFIADYVMMGYGTGAIMAVPAHDQRDYDFAKAFGVDIIEVIKGGDVSVEAYTGDGEMVNSGFLNGYTNKKESIARAIEEVEKMGIGKGGVQFKMKDWAFNRQRYWGEPIPIVHCEYCGDVAVPYEELPLRLPNMENFEPGQEGESPLARIESYVNCKCPKCGKDAKRETDTMPQWAGSSWYYLRYIDPKNDTCLADMDKLNYWMPVDWYNGGMEHVTRHMIYSRFWHQFLYDLGAVNTPEPYAKRSAQGLILGPDGDKMSKSKGNVIDPLDIVSEFGADTLRTYVLFMGDYGVATPWNDSSMKGCKRFLERVSALTDMISDEAVESTFETKMHKTIKKVTLDIEEMKFNTAIASLMALLNDIYAVGHISKENLMIFVKLLCPFAPHISEEMWEMLGGEGFASLAQWPEYDEAKTVDANIEIGVQVNGKLKTTIVIPNNADKDLVLGIAKADEKIVAITADKTIVKEIYVPNKIVNIVVK
ncbi:MAG: leucine--tRNA ligase [Lachnospiraceae bacterium]|nr:leucine--tRNA ligase [Lachnospiraceae bacterium]